MTMSKFSFQQNSIFSTFVERIDMNNQKLTAFLFKEYNKLIYQVLTPSSTFFQFLKN
jgi:hypothetical protein